MPTTPRMCAEKPNAEKPNIVIIDSKKLRQAGIVRLLDSWGGALGLTVSAVELASSIERHWTASCAIVILSIGGASVEDPPQQTLITDTRKLMPRTPLVVLSDREEPNEVRAAFEAGAAAFMPTSIDPSVALQALSFIKCGGSFFPPSALRKEMPPQPPAATQVAVDQPDRSHIQSLRPPSRPGLSDKQEQVLKLLVKGQSNKVIASQLGLSEATVKVHLGCIMRKLGVANRTQVAIASIELNSVVS
jgi:DNA-binding NarL/FixJ family response regulator